MTSNEEQGVCYAQPRTLADRLAIAKDFVAKNDYGLPMLVDRMENAANEVYAGWPERLYVIDASGRVAYKGKTGPFGYAPDEVEAWFDARK